MSNSRLTASKEPARSSSSGTASSTSCPALGAPCKVAKQYARNYIQTEPCNCEDLSAISMLHVVVLAAPCQQAHRHLCLQTSTRTRIPRIRVDLMIHTCYLRSYHRQPLAESQTPTSRCSIVALSSLMQAEHGSTHAPCLLAALSKLKPYIARDRTKAEPLLVELIKCADVNTAKQALDTLKWSKAPGTPSAQRWLRAGLLTALVCLAGAYLWRHTGLHASSR